MRVRCVFVGYLAVERFSDLFQLCSSSGYITAISILVYALDLFGGLLLEKKRKEQTTKKSNDPTQRTSSFWMGPSPNYIEKHIYISIDHAQNI